MFSFRFSSKRTKKFKVDAGLFIRVGTNSAVKSVFKGPGIMNMI